MTPDVENDAPWGVEVDAGQDVDADAELAQCCKACEGCGIVTNFDRGFFIREHCPHCNGTGEV